MRIVFKKSSFQKLGMILYLFILIFQPQVIPITTIYLTGFFTLGYVLLKGKWRFNFSIYRKAGMTGIYAAFLLLSIYIVIISVFDILLGGVTVYINRIKCINQLIILTGIEFVCISFFFQKCDEYGLNFDDIIKMIVCVGIMQGVCSLVAFASPSIRNFFLRYAGNVFKNAYVLERRGYGFSSTLIDTYGYGVGLIAGIILLYKNINLNHKIVSITLCMISIVLNARTGLVVFAIALILHSFKSQNIKTFLIKGIIALITFYIIFKYAFPVLLLEMSHSSSRNLQWIANGINDLLNITQGSSSLNDVKIFSSFRFPEDAFIWIFGSGHNVYAIAKEIGFHSDIGFINYLWEFGVLGIFIMFCALNGMYLKAFKVSEQEGKFVVIFLFISYIAVLFKGILIGYNPGVVVNYFICFAFIYFTKSNFN